MGCVCWADPAAEQLAPCPRPLHWDDTELLQLCSLWVSWLRKKTALGKMAAEIVAAHIHFVVALLMVSYS